MEAVIAFVVKATKASSSEGEVFISWAPENRRKDNWENENFRGAASGMGSIFKWSVVVIEQLTGR